MAQLLPTRTAAARHQPSTHPTQDAPNRLTPPASPARPNECPDDTGRNPGLPARPRITVSALLPWGVQDVALERDLTQPNVDLCDDGRRRFFEDASH